MRLAQLGAEFLCDGDASSHAKGARRDLETWCSLSAFVFAESHFVKNIIYHIGRVAECNEVRTRFVLYHMPLKNRVQNLVGRQGILVG